MKTSKSIIKGLHFSPIAPSLKGTDPKHQMESSLIFQKLKSGHNPIITLK
jgi:hypothetical protein